MNFLWSNEIDLKKTNEKNISKFFLMMKVLCAAPLSRLSNQQFNEFQYELNGNFFMNDNIYRNCNK